MDKQAGICRPHKLIPVMYLLKLADGWKSGKLFRLLPALAILFSACQAPTTPSTAIAIFPTHTNSPVLTATSPSTATPTSASGFNPIASLIAASSPTAAATHTPDQIVYFDPSLEATSFVGYRPPLYPTPWAPTPFDHFYLSSPIAANEINTPVADYRYGGIFFKDVVHTGVDIPAPKSTPVLAAGAGTVIWAGYGVYRGGVDPTDPYGLAVTIRHDFGYHNQALYTIYGHLDQIDVIEGEHVEAGDLLGLVGETGTVTGPHLHFEVRLGENSFFSTRNPELWLVPPMGWGVIAGRVMATSGQLLSDQIIIITDVNTEQNWFGWSYGKTAVNSDAYYQENLVVGDMPAGTYRIRIAYYGMYFTAQMDIQPGMVNYFTFRGYQGIKVESPPAPGVDFTPAPPTTTTP